MMNKISTERDIMYFSNIVVYTFVSMMVIHLSINKNVTTGSVIMLAAIVFYITLLESIPSIDQEVLTRLKIQSTYRIVTMTVLNLGLPYILINGLSPFLPALLILIMISIDLKLTDYVSDTYDGTIYAMYEFKYTELVRIIDLSYMVLILYIAIPAGSLLM